MILYADKNVKIAFEANAVWFSKMVNGQWIPHRMDGPALQRPEESRWFINGFEVTDKIKQWASDRNINLKNMTDIEKTILRLEWSSYNE